MFSSICSKHDSVQKMYPGHIPFYNFLQMIYVGGDCRGQETPCQSGQMVQHRSFGDRRHGCRRKFEGSCCIVVVAEVGVCIVGFIGTRGAWGKWLQSQ